VSVGRLFVLTNGNVRNLDNKKLNGLFLCMKSCLLMEEIDDEHPCELARCVVRSTTQFSCGKFEFL